MEGAEGPEEGAGCSRCGEDFRVQGVGPEGGGEGFDGPGRVGGVWD